MTYIGARFLQTDFQVHSPRDRNWEGARPEDTLTDVTNENVNSVRADWARDFINTCIDRGIQAVAFTDHHEGIYQWHVIDRVKESKDTDTPIDLWVFPAMELTTMDSAQAIIIFDADITRQLFEKARNILSLPADCNSLAKQGIAVELLKYNIADLQGRLQADDELKDRFIILPNVTPKGHKTVLRQGFHKRFHDMPYVGGYLDKCYPDDLDAGDKRILEGEIPAWTSEKRGVICTSDSRNADYDRLGSYSTWIKLAEPTAESIRQAMLAADSRIRYEEPDEPDSFIKSVAIEGGEFLSVENLRLSPQLNSVIGGRGAGKSTLLEYIRFALGRSAIDLESSDWDPTYERRKTLIEQSLDSETGKIRVEVSLNDAVMCFERKRASLNQIKLKIGDTERVHSPSEVRDLLHLQTYSQGELSHLGRESAEKRLLELITDPKRETFDRMSEELNQLANDLIRQLNCQQELWTHERRLRQHDAEIEMTLARIASLKQAMDEAPEQAQAILEKQTEYSKTDRFLDQLSEAVSHSSGTIATAIDSSLTSLQEKIDFGEGITLTDGQSAHVAAIEATQQLSELRATALNYLTNLSQTLDQIVGEWKPKKQSHDEEYKTIMQRVSGKKEKADLVLRLEAELEQHQNEREDTLTAIASLTGSIKIFEQKAESYRQLQLDKINLTAESLSAIEEYSGGLARAELAQTVDLSAINEAIDILCEKANIRTGKDELVAQIQKNESPLLEWWAIIGETIKLLRWKDTQSEADKDLPHTQKLQQAFGDAGLWRIVERLNPERLGTMIRAIAKPRPRILQVRGDREIDFLQASQGERATTILTILMSQDSGPLLIDQPEEDLDNNVINDIVKATRSAKDSRQIIFATHNANLVVNGDAELVIDLLNGEIASQGAIDSKDVRESITRTMEGGKDAFELRRKKYNF